VSQKYPFCQISEFVVSECTRGGSNVAPPWHVYKTQKISEISKLGFIHSLFFLSSLSSKSSSSIFFSLSLKSSSPLSISVRNLPYIPSKSPVFSIILLPPVKFESEKCQNKWVNQLGLLVLVS